MEEHIRGKGLRIQEEELDNRQEVLLGKAWPHIPGEVGPQEVGLPSESLGQEEPCLGPGGQECCP